MTATVRARALGAKTLQEVADYYGKSRNAMYALYHRNQRQFNAMVFGYVHSNWIDAELSKASDIG